MNYVTRISFVALLSTIGAPAAAFAQAQVRDLTQLSIEDLMDIEVTSASRKEQHAADVAAAVFVITRDDIRRSGMTTIPDVLRLAPGVQVAQINANKWAVSIRGFNGLYANKLLVLIDGRSVYNRLFSGVLWDAEDLMLDDVDRVEVVRGPGAAMWGANAVNGVINIITRTAADTQGGVLRADGGGAAMQGAIRYGGTAGATPYRVYAQWTDRHESLLSPGNGADDASRTVTTGFRADWARKPGSFVLEGAFTAGRGRALWPNLDPGTADREPFSADVSDSGGGHLLGRWMHKRAGGASLQVQSFADIASREEPVGDYRRRAFDIETQYHTALGRHHDLVAGGGYRFIAERFDGRVGFSLDPAEGRSSVVSAFVQDEVALVGDRLRLTVGSQVQYDSQSGAGVQPTARAMWTLRPGQRLWAAASRALRTPSLSDRGIHVEFPPVPTASGVPMVVTVRGNPAAETEVLSDLEAGYRLDVGPAASIDVTGFVGRYAGLSTLEPGLPVLELVPSPRVHVTSQRGNLLAASTRGLEIAGHWTPVRAWRIDGSYSAFRVTPRLAAASRDPFGAREDGNTPRSQWQLRSVLSPGARAVVSLAIFRVGPLDQLGVDGYTRADVTAEWRLNRHLSAMAIGENLFDPAHAEFARDMSGLLATEVRRSASVRLRWTFR